MATRIYFPLYVDNFLGGTQDFTPAETGVYIKLLCHQFSYGSIPSETPRLFRITNSQTDEERAAVDFVIRSKFTDRSDGTMVNERLASELQRIDGLATTSRENGKKGGRPKKPRRNPDHNPDETQTITQTITQTKPRAKPRASDSNSERSNASSGIPTVEEVQEYIQAKGYSFDAVDFVAYYGSQGWKKANGQKVTNWKLCCATFQKNQQNRKAIPRRTQINLQAGEDFLAQFEGNEE